MPDVVRRRTSNPPSPPSPLHSFPPPPSSYHLFSLISFLSAFFVCFLLFSFLFQSSFLLMLHTLAFSCQLPFSLRYFNQNPSLMQNVCYISFSFLSFFSGLLLISSIYEGSFCTYHLLLYAPPLILSCPLSPLPLFYTPCPPEFTAPSDIIITNNLGKNLSLGETFLWDIFKYMVEKGPRIPSAFFLCCFLYGNVTFLNNQAEPSKNCETLAPGWS